MRLIDADELKRKYAGWYNVYGKNKSIRCVEVKEIDWMPTIDVVPLDILCAWLESNCLYNPNPDKLPHTVLSAETWQAEIEKVMEGKENG